MRSPRATASIPTAMRACSCQPRRGGPPLLNPPAPPNRLRQGSLSREGWPIMSIGARVYGLAAIVLGTTGLVFGSFAAMGLPVPPHIPAYPILLWAAAGLLILAGLALNLRRTAATGAL